jgi:anti-sigma B factor antagonist
MIFSYNLQKKQGVSIYSLQGELIDRSQASGMMDEVEEAITRAENKILLDLEQLRYINSSGLNILINILTKSRKSGGDVAICCVNKKIAELLLITKLNSVFNVCGSTKEAIAVLNKE